MIYQYLLLVLLWSPGNNDLCSVEAVYINGNSESATALRNTMTEMTGLSLAKTKDAGNAILEIVQTDGTSDYQGTILRFEDRSVRINGLMKRYGSDEILWSHTHGPLSTWSPAKNFWKQWKKDTKDCGKPEQKSKGGFFRKK